MSEEEKNLLEKFRKMDPANKVNLLANIQVAYSAQENTKRAILAAVHMQKPKRSA